MGKYAPDPPVDSAGERREQLRQSQQFEQGLAGVSDMVPRMCKGLFDGFVREGFSEPHALELTKTYLSGMVPAPRGET
jgi:hypothetical protein